MSIQSLYVDTTGQIDVHPRIVKMISTDTLDTIIVPNYIRQHPFSTTLMPSDIVLCNYKSSFHAGLDWTIFTLIFSNQQITLSPSFSEEIVSTIDYIATFENTTGQLQSGSNPAINPGVIQSGTNGGGVTGSFKFFPTTLNSGSFLLSSANLSTNSQISITTASTFGQATSFVVPDPGSSTGTILTSANPADGNGANYVYSRKAGLTASQFASAASVTLQPSSGSKSYIVADIWVGKGTNFSGGGGDRNLSITDGTTVYSVIPAASLQTLINSKWGNTASPLPASVTVATPTTNGAALVAKYSGGSVDYTAGVIDIAVSVIRIG